MKKILILMLLTLSLHAHEYSPLRDTAMIDYCRLTWSELVHLCMEKMILINKHDERHFDLCYKDADKIVKHCKEEALLKTE